MKHSIEIKLENTTLLQGIVIGSTTITYNSDMNQSESESLTNQIIQLMEVIPGYITNVNEAIRK